MPKILALLLLSSFLLSACQADNTLLKIKKESTEAYQNLQGEYLRLKEETETKIEQAQATADSISRLIESLSETKARLDETTENLKALTGAETELSSENQESFTSTPSSD